MPRGAHIANTVIFFMTGAVYAAWATRIPAIKERLDLSSGELGLAILGLEGGAVVGLTAGAALVARAGSRASLRLGFVLYPGALLGVALAPGLAALAAALGAMAASSSVVDVAMNAQGVELERRSGRRLLSGMHAGHPLGLVAGGLVGAAAAAAGVPVVAHFAAAAMAGVAVGVGATRWLVREPRRRRERTFVRPSRGLVVLGLAAFCAFLLDGAAANWIAVHVRGERGAGPELALRRSPYSRSRSRWDGLAAIARLRGTGGRAWFRAVGPWRCWAAPWPSRRRPQPLRWSAGPSSAWDCRRSCRQCSEPRRTRAMPRRRLRSRSSARSGIWARSRARRWSERWRKWAGCRRRSGCW